MGVKMDQKNKVDFAGDKAICYAALQEMMNQSISEVWSEAHASNETMRDASYIISVRRIRNHMMQKNASFYWKRNKKRKKIYRGELDWYHSPNKSILNKSYQILLKY